jgi:zinc transport system substrate-binding protein
MKPLTAKLMMTFLLLFFAQPVLAAKPVPVFVSILPQKYFVQQIGGDRVDVSVMVKPGADPHTYEPKPSQMAKLSKARLYFSIGVPFENFWLDKFEATNRDLTIVHTDEGAKKIEMAAHHHGDEEPGGEEHHDGEHHEGEHHDGEHHDEGHHEEDHHEGHHDEHAEEGHGHEGLDPHVWTSPERVLMIAGKIFHALVAADPASQEYYTRNHEAFVKELRQLDGKLREMFKKNQGMKFMVFHPAWGYLAHDYGLVQVPIEVEGKNPKPAQLKELIHHARDEQVKIIFVQPQFSSKSAELVAREIRGRVVKADPLAENWKENILTIAAQFKEALK